MNATLEHHVLKADLEAAASELGVTVVREEEHHTSEDQRAVCSRVLRLRLPLQTDICARFVREGWIERAKKLFVSEIEVGVAWFDDLIYVVTSTPDLTKHLLEERRVQQALVLLVDPTRSVEIACDEVRVVDEDARGDARDAAAEALAIAAQAIALRRV